MNEFEIDTIKSLNICLNGKMLFVKMVCEYLWMFARFVFRDLQPIFVYGVMFFFLFLKHCKYACILSCFEIFTKLHVFEDKILFQEEW